MAKMLLTMVLLNVVGMVAPGPDIFLVLRLAAVSYTHLTLPTILLV